MRSRKLTGRRVRSSDVNRAAYAAAYHFGKPCHVECIQKKVCMPNKLWIDFGDTFLSLRNPSVRAKQLVLQALVKSPIC